MTAPYYEDEHVTLFHGDCLELVELWTGADVLVTDPPYGIPSNIVSGHRGPKRPGWKPTFERQPEWDSTLDVRDAVLGLWGDRPYAMFGSARRIDAAPPHREIPLVWDKAWIGMGDTTFPWGSGGYELIYVSGQGWAGRRGTSVLRHPLTPGAPKQIGHPTPKPIPLMAHLIDRAPAGVVADPFAGSGSTLVAAKQLGRKAIGVELDERYCEVAARRLSQGVLDFGEATA